MKRPNGAGTIVKLSGKRRRPFAVRVFDGVVVDEKGNGHLKYKYLGYFEKQKDALAFLEKYNTSPVTLAKPEIEKNKHRFSEIYDLYIEELEKSKNLSHQSYNSRNAAYKQLKKLHNMVFENITIDDIENVMSEYSNSSPSTVTNQRVVIKGMYKTAMRHKYVSEDLSALLLTRHTNEPIRPHKPFTDEEIDLLWQHSDDFYIRLYLILIYTGMRINELLKMKSEDVFFDQRYMIGGLKTESGKNRIIPIAEKIAPFLDTSSEYLISDKGKKISYQKAQNMTNASLEPLGMKHSFHDARHTCASLMERAGVDILHRKRILGHKSTDITDHYTHLQIDELINDINKI